ncbi:major facilitator superfamily MFS_1 [Kribbella flavida DSM 17836]|uniref:Major facilitator superfamily MFS_1 n=1 Tax=Kribbella flavida (strain DSM 17836 / JCM 10339 / NBRC 14399) TaxID=479435 RepID=D2Q4Z0_KRIFD|nr:MFS transporter [Kribbella flavida]ADB34245.1 major facilitator superfamily MFS_1 [Kribbella flavida DSM 17836]
MTWREDLAVLRHRDVRIFVSARFIAILGSSIAPIALAFAVLDVSDTASAVGLVLAARSIPNVVFLLVGGVIADRLPRHLVLVVANTVSALTQGLAGVLVLSGHAEIWQLVVIEAVNGAAAAFVMPAMMGILPALVDHAELPQANAISGFARSAALIGGGAVAGVIVGFTSPGIGLAVDAATFAVAAVLIGRLTLPPVERSTTSMLRDLRVGWTEFASRQWVWSVVAAFCVLNLVFTACYMTLGPVIADDTFGRAGWGLVSAAFGAGLVLGGVVMIRLKPRYPVRAGMFGMLAGLPVFFALALAPSTITVAAAAFVVGLGFEIFGIGWETALGQHIPLDKLSRVASYDMLGSFVAGPVGQLTVGYVAAMTSVKAVELYGAGIYLVVVILTLMVPAVWHLRRDVAAVDV